VSESRLTSIPYEDWDFEALAEISPGMKPPEMSVVGFFAHHPELARSYLSWNHYVNSRRSSLSREIREIAILRVARVRNSGYEWAQHVKIARRAGISDETVAKIRSDEKVPGVAGLIVAAVDELAGSSAIGDETYAALAREFSEKQLIDLVFLIGTYSMLSMAFNTFGVELEGT